MVRLLGRALESAPLREQVPRAQAAAEEIGDYADCMAQPGLSGEDRERAALEALTAASTAFVRLGRGPYRSAPEVLERAQALADEIAALRAPRARAGDEVMIRLYRRAQLVLTAMHSALGIGEVRSG